jgi:hypothetical protein
MYFRQALLAAVLVSGTAVVATAQSDELPFRRFGSRTWIMPRLQVRPFRFSMRDNERLRAGLERMRFRLQGRNDELANRLRLREFGGGDLALRLRDRGFAMHDNAMRHQMEYRFRDMDRMKLRMRDRMDHFRLERPMIMRRRSRTI